MDKRICFLYTETTGLHQTHEPVSKKNLYTCARMVTMNYVIGTYGITGFVEELKIRHIIKPRCMYIPESTVKFHGITQDTAIAKGIDPVDVLTELKENLKNVHVIVSHNIDFHIKTVLAEAVKYNIQMPDLSKYIIIDTISFFHDYDYIKLSDLATKLAIKKIPDANIEIIMVVFFKLYEKFKKQTLN